MITIYCRILVWTSKTLMNFNDRLTVIFKQDVEAFNLFCYRNKYRVKRKRITKYDIYIIKIQNWLYFKRSTVYKKLLDITGHLGEKTNHKAYYIIQKYDL